MAAKDQLQKSFQKPYELGVFCNEILIPVFSDNRTEIFTKENFIFKTKDLSITESKIISEVKQYGNLKLDDGAVLNLYEIKLQPQVRLEHNKVSIQQYIRKILVAGEAVLVNFIQPDNLETWRFSLIASDTKLTDKGIKEVKLNAKRYTFIVGKNEMCRTVAERFADLEKQLKIVLHQTDNEKNVASLVKAFSVEILSTSFFDEYTFHYLKFVEDLKKSKYRKSVFDITFHENATHEEIDKECKPIRDFAKKLLGRIVFLYFVQKKGWLGAKDVSYVDGYPDFMMKLFEDSGANESFYPNWLSPLFLKTLNEKRINDNYTMPNGEIVKVPFLNGGLFEKEEYDENLLTFDPNLFHSKGFDDVILTKNNAKTSRGFLDFLNAYNFTIHEDSPDDHTVAVDPEMLGHIFENLLEDNKDKGAFYTPKQIVHYMCQQSIIEYLNTKLNPNEIPLYDHQGTGLRLTKSQQDSQNLITIENPMHDQNHQEIEDFVKNKNANDFIFANANAIDGFLDAVKICDPAIGSGAFPMGLMQEIFALKMVLHDFVFATSNELFHTKDYSPQDYRIKTKLNIIQNSIYGVDIEKGAVNIARLRFWLSLIVDETLPKALPNLDYKIVVGDSLISKFDNEIIEIDWDKKSSVGKADGYVKNVQKLLAEVAIKQEKYFVAENSAKKKLALEIRADKIELLINQIMFNKEHYLNKNSKKIDSGLGLSAKDKINNLDIENVIYRFDHTLKKLNNLAKNTQLAFNHFDWKLDFPEVLNPLLVTEPDYLGFDIVIGNPPYFQLREIEKSLQEAYQKTKYYKYAIGGRLNVYQFFIPLSIDNSKKNGIICLIKQNSLLGEDTAINNRKYIFDNTEIISFDSFPERDNVKRRVFENVKMSVVISLLKKQEKIDYNFKVNVWNEKHMLTKKELVTSKKEISIIYPNNLIIPITDQLSLNVLKKIKKLENCFYVKSQAGEIDMTKFKSKFNYENNGIRVYTGAQIQRYFTTLRPSQGDVYHLTENNYPKSGKFNFVNKERIAMQRITGVDSKLRLIMSIIPVQSLCSNSVNFIQNENPVELRFILSVLNSKLINVYFKFTSTNTNITTTEINSIPIPNITELLKENFSSITNYILYLKSQEISEISNQLISAYFEQIIDGMVYELYFPELLNQHNRTIIEHLGELPEITNEMTNDQKMAIINKVFNRLDDKNHPLRVNLFYMNSIPEIKIIEGN